MSADNYRDTLITIVEKSATLAERLSGEFVPINDPTEAEIIETRLSTWIQTAAQGDPERFRKRLEWDGLTLEQVKPLLGSVRRRDSDAPLPRWGDLLGEVLQLGKEISKDNLHRHNRIDRHSSEMPFEELFIPFRRITFDQISKHPHFRTYFQGNSSRVYIQHIIFKWLLGLSIQALMIAFRTFQVIEYGSFDDKPPNRYYGQEHEKRYNAFVRRMLAGEAATFFTDYAVLARLMATVTLNFIGFLGEFLDQVNNEYPSKEMSFLGSTGRIGALQIGYSDRHKSGRTVVEVLFRTNPPKSIIYKPKSLGNEIALNTLMNWCNKKHIFPEFRTLYIADRYSHGWMEKIRRGSFKNQTQMTKYYQHAGTLLGFIHFLAANDCHNENVVQDGEQPILIDAETLLHYRVPDIEYHFSDARATAHKIIENSVLRTQFLPKWDFTTNGTAYDISTLGSYEYQDGGPEQPKLRPPYAINNYMQLEYEKKYIRMVVDTWEPQFPISPKEYETEIINGFTEMYRFLMAHREELLAEGSPLEGFKNQRVRYVFRPTQTYQTVLQHTLQPRYLHDGIDRSIQIESLNRVLLAWDEKPAFWDIHKGEAQAIEQMDVPLLTYNSSDTSLHIGDITIENAFGRPAYNLVIERLNSMSEDDLQQQIAFIRGSLFCRIAHELPDTDDEMPSVLQNAPTLPRELLISEAGQIADELQAQAIWGEDGSATWITLTYHFAANRYQFGQISDGLYDGACGVAFFLAALHHVAGWTGARELGLAAIKPLQNRLYHPVLSQRLARKLGVNGPSGFKSIAYALRQISEWLDEPRLLDDVLRVENLINPALDAAEKKAGRIPENVFAQSAGRWRIESRLPDRVQLWGLYGGRAGIGYELLKLLDTSLPSIPF